MQQRVREAIGQVGCERLKPVFEHLESSVDYARIRIVATVWQIEQEDAGD